MEGNMFSALGGSFTRGGPWFYPVILPPASFPVSHEEVDRDRARILRMFPMPQGMTLQFPYIVKVKDGEYVVQADGTEVFYSAREGRWITNLL
jgi:hypothetical protein